MRELIDKYFVAKKITKIAVCGNDEEVKQIINLVGVNKKLSIVDIKEAEIVVIADEENYFKIEREISEKYLVEIISVKEMMDKIRNNIKYITA